ncbi:hypothetical protein Belba_1529 [Belliella baltica DSM 15883]|uniref:Uncharacterized protein n=2 Tax=Belliella TaxID=232244 RepID=I3Z4H3_BELBD|nr:hypothetical protein Belba_1529 [Belliella baltica DSM 15883]
MEITCTFGSFKIMQTMENKDELLIVSKWKSLSKVFGSSRIFMINKKESVFGVYVCKQECAETLIELIKSIDYRDWEHFKINSEIFSTRLLA